MPQAIPAIIIAASAAVGAAGAISAGRASEKAAKYNAEVAEQDAIAAQKKATYDESIHRDKVKRLLSTQRAITGKAGLSMTGSPLLATLDTVEKGELDALAIRFGADISSQRSLSSAAASRLEGSAASTASKFKAGSTLLSGAARSYSAL